MNTTRQNTTAPAHKVAPTSDAHLTAGCVKGQQCRVWAARIHDEDPKATARAS